MNQKRHHGWKKRRGFALYLVAFVVAILSLGALALVALMMTERSATRIRGNEIQTNQGCQSGVELARLVVSMTEQERRQIGGIENNPRYFAGIEIMPGIATSNAGTLRTTLLSPLIQNGAVIGVRYGLVNESSRLNLAAVLKWELESPGQGRQALMSLPGMTPSIADSILDWIDPDNVARSSGAELEYYQRIGVPYGPRNAVPVSLEELLLIRDVTRPVLFGNDATFSFGFAPNSSPNHQGTENWGNQNWGNQSSFDSAGPVSPISPHSGFVGDQQSSPFSSSDNVGPTANNVGLTANNNQSGLISGTDSGQRSNPFGDEGERRIGDSSTTTTGSGFAGSGTTDSGVLNSANRSSGSGETTPTTSFAQPNSLFDSAMSGSPHSNAPEFGLPGSSPFSQQNGFDSSNSSHSGSNILPWCYLLTTLSAEKEVNPFGIPKFDLNESNLEYLYGAIEKAVDEETARFVILLRQNGPKDPLSPESSSTAISSANLANTSSNGTAIDFSKPGSFQLTTPLDLLNVAVPGTKGNPLILNQTQGKERFLRLLDFGTTNKEVVQMGRVNINEAPIEVLRAVPGINNDIAVQILSRRAALAANRPNDMRHPVWLLNENLIDLNTLKNLWNKITCGGDVFRSQVVGYFDRAGTSSRCEVVLDGTVQPPRQVFFKDLTMYGRGFPHSVLSPSLPSLVVP